VYGALSAAAAKQRLRLLLGAHPNTAAFQDRHTQILPTASSNALSTLSS
jgi:hypothetical protein